MKAAGLRAAFKHTPVHILNQEMTQQRQEPIFIFFQAFCVKLKFYINPFSASPKITLLSNCEAIHTRGPAISGNPSAKKQPGSSLLRRAQFSHSQQSKRCIQEAEWRHLTTSLVQRNRTGLCLYT